jgi:HK97 family phage portal protein
VKAGVLQAIFGSTQPVSDGGGWLIRAIGGGKTKAGVSVSEHTALNHSAVWACTTLLADVISMLPADVLRREGENRVQQDGHPVARLLNDSANEEMPASVVRNTRLMHALLWGNGYSEAEFNGRGVPVSLWPLMPDRTEPYVGFGEDRLRRLRYRSTIEGASVNLPPRRVLHIKGYSFDGICGVSPISVARQAIGLGVAMEEFGSKFFANDAKSGGFVMHPGKLSAKAQQNITESFGPADEGGQGGLDNAHKVKVLEEGAKFISTMIPPEDAQFLGSRNFQVAEIARIYRIPLILLQVIEGSTVWGTGIEQLLIGFVRNTLRPWIRREEEELGRKLLSEAERRAGFYIRFNLNALLQGDSAARAAFYTAMYNIRALTPNEIRSREDMNPYDEGDQFGGTPNSGEATGVGQSSQEDNNAD